MEATTETFDSLIEKFFQNTNQMVGVLENINEATFCLKPKNGGWSIAEVIEHLLISDRTALFAIVRRTLPTNRNPLEIAQMLNERKNNPVAKFQAPEPALPKGIFKSQDEAISTWKNNRSTIIEKVNPQNIWLLAAGFEHPKLGMLTAAEWILFMCWHSEHHLLQIKACAGI